VDAELKLVAEAVGCGLAAFVVNWFAFMRPMQGRLNQAASPEEIQKLTSALADVRENMAKRGAQQEAQGETLEQIRRTAHSLEARVGRLVTDEEFGAYTCATNACIQNLVEKIGHAAGVIETLSSGLRPSSGGSRR